MIFISLKKIYRDNFKNPESFKSATIIFLDMNLKSNIGNSSIRVFIKKYLKLRKGYHERKIEVEEA